MKKTLNKRAETIISGSIKIDSDVSVAIDDVTLNILYVWWWERYAVYRIECTDGACEDDGEDKEISESCYDLMNLIDSMF